MVQVTRIHGNKRPPDQRHFIPEWAAHRGLRQVDIVQETGIDKGTVSRWWRGVTPSYEHQDVLAALFRTDRPGLFRHPDDDWLARFFRNRSEADKERARRILEEIRRRLGNALSPEIERDYLERLLDMR